MSPTAQIIIIALLIAILGICTAAFVGIICRLFTGINRHFYEKKLFKKLFNRYHVGKYGDNE